MDVEQAFWYFCLWWFILDKCDFLRFLCERNIIQKMFVYLLNNLIILAMGMSIVQTEVQRYFPYFQSKFSYGKSSFPQFTI